MTTDTFDIPLSVSRVKLADKCSLAYRYHYIDNIPAPQEAAAKVFGIVVHNGVELWYGDIGSDNHKNTRISTYVHQLWFEHLPTDIGIALRHCLAAEKACEDLVQLILIHRPTLKSPRTCKEYEVSEEKSRFDSCTDELMQAATKCETMRWPKDENAFRAYMKSMHIANTLQARWEHKPRPLGVECGFNVEFGGMNIRGRIDQIRADPNPQGEVSVEGLDIKTGRQMLSQMDAFLQAFLYNEACIQTPELPIPDYWTFLMARPNKPQHGKIDRERHSKLAKRILDRVRRQIESEDYAPQYGFACTSCDFKQMCEAEISMWPPGTDSLVLDLT